MPKRRKASDLTNIKIKNAQDTVSVEVRYRGNTSLLFGFGFYKRFFPEHRADRLRFIMNTVRGWRIGGDVDELDDLWDNPSYFVQYSEAIEKELLKVLPVT